MIDLLIAENKNIQTSRQLAELFCLEKNRKNTSIFFIKFFFISKEYCKPDQLEELYKPIPTPPAEEEEEEETAVKEEEEDKSEL